MHTKDILAAALADAGLHDMAAKARTGHYHDYLSDLAMPCMQLSNDLTAAGTDAALALRSRHHAGEFDANTEEGDQWAQSKEGREAYSLLTPAMRKALLGQ